MLVLCDTRFLVDHACIPPLCDLLTVMDSKIVQVALSGLENILHLVLFSIIIGMNMIITVCLFCVTPGSWWTRAASHRCVTCWQWWTARLCRWPLVVWRTSCIWCCSVSLLVWTWSSLCVCFVWLQVPGGPGLHSTAVWPADSDGQQDCAGGSQWSGEHPAPGVIQYHYWC